MRARAGAVVKNNRSKQKRPAVGERPRLALRSTARPVGWTIGAGVLLAVTVAAVYLPVVQCGYIWDDDGYILNNDTLRSCDGLRRIWLELTAAPQEYPQYYPLVYTTFWIEYQVWQTDPRGYHVVNVLLHAWVAVLLWRLLTVMQIPGAWWAAALFGLHPVHVESVAWITERKNVLAGVFYMAAALAYLRFALPRGADRPAAHRRWFYVGAVGLFLCALLSKTVTCTLPAVLLLVLWWQRGRIGWRDVLSLAPLFMLGIAFGLLTSWMEKRYVGATGETWNFGFLARCLIAGRVPWFYAGKLLWPHPLIFIYPRWRIDAGDWLAYLYPLAAATLIAVLVLARRRIGRGPLVAVLCFGGTLFPALGFFNVYPMRYSFVADHFQYLGSASILALVAAAGCRLVRRMGGWSRPIAVPIAVLLLGALGTLSWHQVHLYTHAESLWRDTLRKNPTAWMAHNNLGRLLERRGELDQASGHYRQAIELSPDMFEPHANLGNVLLLQGQVDAALDQYRRAVEIDARQPSVCYNLATLLADRGEWDAAIRHYRQTLALSPNAAQAHLNLGWVLMKQGKLDEAVQHFHAALRLRPAYPEAHLQLGLALRRQGQIDLAIDCYRRALQLRPEFAQAHYQLGVALARQGKATEALEQYREAARIDPNDADARRALNAASAEKP